MFHWHICFYSQPKILTETVSDLTQTLTRRVKVKLIIRSKTKTIYKIKKNNYDFSAVVKAFI